MKTEPWPRSVVGQLKALLTLGARAGQQGMGVGDALLTMHTPGNNHRVTETVGLACKHPGSAKETPLGVGQPAKLLPDIVQNAHQAVMDATGRWPKTRSPGERSDAETNRDAVSGGSMGAQRGVPARGNTLSPEELNEITRKAAMVRWTNT